MGKTLLRYSRMRRTEPQTGADDSLFAKGRAYEADCLAGDAIGNFVYVTGPEVSGLPQVSTVDVTDASKVPAVGVIVEKSTATRCVVQVIGETSIFTTVPGDRYFISTSGTATNVPPTPSGSDLYQQLVGVGLESSRLLLSFNGQFVRMKS